MKKYLSIFTMFLLVFIIVTNTSIYAATKKQKLSVYYEKDVKSKYKDYKRYKLKEGKPEDKVFFVTNKTVKNFDAVPLLVDIYKEGQLVYKLPSLSEIQDYARQEFDKLWDEYKRVLNPQDYPVDLARDIWQDKMDLIDQMRKKAYQTGAEK